MTMRSQDRQSAAAALVTHARDLYQRGWMDGTSGNLSVRLAAQEALITVSGVSKGRLTSDDTILVDATTGQVLHDDGRKPSAETSIHTALYSADPHCQAVVHAHTPYATVAASLALKAGQPLLHLKNYELIKGLTPGATRISVPVFQNWVDVGRIADDVFGFLSQHRPPGVLLIADHGMTAWGETIDQAHNRIECLEAICQLMFIERTTALTGVDQP